MKLGTSSAIAAPSPHIYNLLDQRLSRQGQPLHGLLRNYATALPSIPTSLNELQEQIISVFGKWSNDASRRVSPDTDLAREHLALLDEIGKIQGIEAATILETTLFRVIANQFARHAGSSLRLPDENKLIALSEVKPGNAYSALAQRTGLSGSQPHEQLKEWIQANREIFCQKPVTEVGYLRLAQRFCGEWPTETTVSGPFQKCVAGFLDGVALATNHGHAVVIQSSLIDTFARAMRRQVRELGLDRPALSSSAMSIA
jgi:hypothetical protein